MGVMREHAIKNPVFFMGKCLRIFHFVWCVTMGIL